MGARLLLYGTLIDNILLNEIESVAIEIVNNHSNKVLLGLNPILTQQQLY